MATREARWGGIGGFIKDTVSSGTKAVADVTGAIVDPLGIVYEQGSSTVADAQAQIDVLGVGEGGRQSAAEAQAAADAQLTAIQTASQDKIDAANKQAAETMAANKAQADAALAAQMEFSEKQLAFQKDAADKALAQQKAIADEQAAIVAAQQAKIDKRNEEIAKVAAERKARMKQRLLLSGDETGVQDKKTTLLGSREEKEKGANNAK